MIENCCARISLLGIIMKKVICIIIFVMLSQASHGSVYSQTKGKVWFEKHALGSGGLPYIIFTLFTNNVI